MKQQTTEFYTSEKEKNEIKLSSVKRKLQLSSTLRLLLFVGFILSIYFFYQNYLAVAGIALLGISLFLFLISKHIKLQYQRDFFKELIHINKTELQVLNGDFFNLEDGAEYQNANHFYSFDIDLFGRGSFFQFMNRTVTKSGRDFLANIFTLNDPKEILQKQKGIQELSNMAEWRQEFSAIGNMIRVQFPVKDIINWIQNYRSILPNFMAFLPKFFSGISGLLIILILIGFIGYPILIIWFLIGLGISGVYNKKVNSIYNKAGRAKQTFRQYHKLLSIIENTNFDSEILITQKSKIQSDKRKASIFFRSFYIILNGFDQRNNMIMALFGNALLLWDLRYANKVEKWIQTHQNEIENWFDVITFFDAYNSLANFDFNNPDYVYPSINQDFKGIDAKDLGHPLLKSAKRIDNDFSIENQQFYIITGANMAGKSTFLRTVSLSIVMANIGLPVCAKTFEYSPIKLITSMRTSDSLTDDESYFFSELKRLKFIVEIINEENSNGNYFIILDEILKGTNSTDKAIGSKKFVQKLISSHSTGIIATHDLSLCEIEKEYKEVKNYYFDAEIIDDELYFDYKLKTGVCKNMNASFLLNKMKII